MTIPKDLQEAVERFCALCQADPRVVAAFVGGSLATGTADEYSDIDVYLIVVDEAYDSFFAERAVFTHQLGEPVYLEDFDGFGFDMVLFIFEDGIKGELALARASSFLHIHEGPYRVLVDKRGLLEGVTFPIERVPVEEQRRNLEHLLKSFWRQLFLLNSALGRGWLLSAASYFEGMRRQLLHACRLSVDFSASGDKPPLETLLPEQLVVGLGQTFPRLDREEMVAAVQEAVRMFQRVAKPLAQTQGVLYPERLERVVRRSMRRHRHFDLWMHEKELMP